MGSELSQYCPKLVKDLMLVSACLDIKGLFCITTKTVENLMKGKTHEEVQEMFDVKEEASLSRSIPELFNKILCCKVFTSNVMKY